MDERISILGVAIDNVDLPAAVERMAGFLAQGGAHHVVTVNPEFVMEAQHNATFRQVLQQADLATPDGFGLILAARWLGTPFTGRATGVDMVQQLAALAAARGYRVFLLGAAPGVAATAAAVLRERYASITIAGCFAGSPSPRHEPFLQQVIAAARPDVLLVAYGHPRQDMWIARNQPVLNVPLAMGVGGVFDYLAGVVPLAPRPVRALGLEWLYRLVRQPYRWRRIVVAVPLFSLAVLRHGRHPRPHV